MLAELKSAETVHFVLFPVLQAVKKTIAEGEFSGNPGIGLRICGTPAGHEIDITVVAGQLKEIIKARARNVGRSEIDRVIPLPDVERPAINGNPFNHRSN